MSEELSVDNEVVGGMRAMSHTINKWYDIFKNSGVVALASLIFKADNTQWLSMKWTIIALAIVFSLAVSVSYWKGELCKRPRHTRPRHLFFVAQYVDEVVDLLTRFLFAFIAYFSITSVFLYAAATSVWVAVAEVSTVLLVGCGLHVFVCIYKDKHD